MNSGVKSRLPVVAAVVVLGACGDPSPEAELSEAGQALDEAEESLATLNQRIEETEERLDDLRDRRRKAKDQLRTLEERVAARATDVALFRAVQSSLLEEPGLRETAINVLVEDTVVTLVGSVPSAAQRDKALDIARSTPGVGEVRSRLRVDDAQQVT